MEMAWTFIVAEVYEPCVWHDSYLEMFSNHLYQRIIMDMCTSQNDRSQKRQYFQQYLITMTTQREIQSFAAK